MIFNFQNSYVFEVLWVIVSTIRVDLQKSYSTMVLHYFSQKFPKSFTKLQIPFLFIFFCLSQITNQKCAKLFLDFYVFDLNYLKKAIINIIFVLNCCWYVTLNIQKNKEKQKMLIFGFFQVIQIKNIKVKK